MERVQGHSSPMYMEESFIFARDISIVIEILVNCVPSVDIFYTYCPVSSINLIIFPGFKSRWIIPICLKYFIPLAKKGNTIMFIFVTQYVEKGIKQSDFS